MKLLALFSAVLLTASRLPAADAEWGTDLAKAQAEAKMANKLVLLDFTGSDWCPPCWMLTGKVLKSRAFKEFAKDNLVLVEVDFPRKKDQPAELKAANKALEEKFAVRGYPTLIVLDGDGKEVFRKVGYAGAPAAEYIAEIAKLRK